MEAIRLELRGQAVDRFADTLVERMAERQRRSLNMRIARNVHRYEGEGVTQVAFEVPSAYQPSWLMVSVLVERVGETRSTVVVLLGGAGEGLFKLEELSPRRLLRGEDSVGEPMRLTKVLRRMNDVAEELDLVVETQWHGESESSTIRTVSEKIFGA